MHKKHHRLHRHKDASHKRPSKSKIRHRQHKNEHSVIESLLEPIQEVSKEKMKIDKNACGDYVHPFLIPENDQKKKSKRHREKEEKTDTIEKLDNEATDIFARNYLQKLKESTKKRLVRHHSLEKKESLLSKTKNLFRKEKSFNDAIHKVSDNLEANKQHKKDRKHRQNSRHNGKEPGEEVQEKKEKQKNREKSSKKSHKIPKEDKLEDKGGKSTKKKDKKNEKSPLGGKTICTRVQEVIYCQMDQVPYKLKNDKSGSEIKDLYQRIKREKKRHQEDSGNKDRTHLHDDSKKKYRLEEDHNRFIQKVNVEGEAEKERSKSSPKREHKNIQKEEKLPDSRKSKSRNHDHGGDFEHPLKKTDSKVLLKRKRKNLSPSNIDLGPYDKYFAFENKTTSEQCHSKHHKKEHKKHSVERKHRKSREEVVYNLEYDHSKNKINQEKSEDKIKTKEDKKLKTDEEKIHQIVEGDLKTYFSKIQHMIDQKLDTLLRIHKSKHKHDHTSDKNVGKGSHKRNKSKTKDKKTETEERSDSKKESKSKKAEEQKQCNQESKDESLIREEIVQEVLKRIRKETEPRKEHDERHKKSKSRINEKHDNKEICEKKIQKDGKKIDNERESSHGKITKNKKYIESVSDKSNSRSQDIVSAQNRSSKKQFRENLEDPRRLSTEIKDSPFRRSLGRKQHNEEESRKTPYTQRKSPDSPIKTNNSIESQILSSSHKSFHKKHRSRERNNLPKDSLINIRKRHTPSPELVIPAADISSFDWEKQTRSKRYKTLRTGAISRREENLYPRSMKKYTSASSCRSYSEHYLTLSVESRIDRKRSEQVMSHRHGHRHVASDEIHRERYHLDTRRGSSSPEKNNKTSEEMKSTRDYQNQYRKLDKMPLVNPKIHSPREHVVVSHQKDYIMAPRELREHKDNSKDTDAYDYCKESTNHSPHRRHSKHDLVVQENPHLDHIILPPEMFRTGGQVYAQEHLRNPETHNHPRQDFLVHGIEPPILECSKRESRKEMRVKKLECKTISIIGIAPQTAVKELSMTSQTQTSSKPHKSASPERDLVERRKQSKRFKLYYKYSAVDNSTEGTSDAKSMVSDSYRAVSDPSEEERALVYNRRDTNKVNERRLTSEVSQIVNIPPKKWNWVATPRESHLNNIVEEPSNVLDTKKNNEYFIPIGGTNECYFRALTSSHSEYCFKINKKPANSNLSVLSRDTCDGRYRYCKYDVRSKSEFKIIPNRHGIATLRSKSDVCLSGASGKKIIKSIFLEDTHPFVRTKKQGISPNRSPPEKSVVKSASRDCQTSNIKIDNDIIVNEEKTQLAFEDKQRQFKNIYKTLDDLEENINSSRKAIPTTLDAAVSPPILSVEDIGDKKEQFQEIYKTIDDLQDKMIYTSNRALVETVDVAIGSPIKTRRCQTSCQSEPRKNTHEIAVGVSKERMLRKAKTPTYRPGSRGKPLKSTGVSPIRVVEDLQSSRKSPDRKDITPRSPNLRPNLVKQLIRKRGAAISDDTPCKKIIPKALQTKKDLPNVILLKETKPKSPERAQIDNKAQKNVKDVDVTQQEHAIRVLRSDEKSVSMKERENIIEKQSKQCKQIENNTNQQGQIDQNKKCPTCFYVDVEDAKPIITLSINKTEFTNKVCDRKAISKAKEETPKKASSRNSGDDIPKSCIHHYHPNDLNTRKPSRTAPVSAKTPLVTTKKPVTVNTALFKYQPSSQKQCVSIGGSTSSSLGDDSDQNVRKSKSLVQVRPQRNNTNRSKSEIINIDQALVIKPSSFETNRESITSGNMEKFANIPRLRCHNSKSNIHSLDQFIGNKFTSRLFLTKDYKGAEISSYQKRKLYDQSIRQKMKKKFRFSKLDVGPQIFEVRFLSMINQEDCQRKEKTVRNYFDKPLKAVRTEGNLYEKDSFVVRNKDEIGIIKDENSNGPLPCDKSGRGPDNQDNAKPLNKIHSALDIIKEDVDSSNCNVDTKIESFNTKVEDNSIIELYFKDKQDFNSTNGDESLTSNFKAEVKDRSVTDETIYKKNFSYFCNKLLEVNTNLELEKEFKGAQCTCSKFSKNCQSCKNFVHFMDMLCSSLASYCDSKNELIDLNLDGGFKFDNLENSNKSWCNNENNSGGNENDVEDIITHEPILQIQKEISDVKEIFCHNNYNPSGGSKESSNQSDKIFKNLVESESFSTTRTEETPPLFHPLSCPILPTNTSSFEFLYEETSSSNNERISREVVLANLTRPFDPTFNFRMSQYNVETPFFRRNSYFSSITGSSESGYASIKSKSCKETSFINFFKKPSIAALFKPQFLTEKKNDLSGICEQKGQGDFKKSILYEKMMKSCQLYAKKVRESSEMKLEEKVDEYQEFSLAFLLGEKSSVLLESKALSQCSGTPNTDDEVKIEEPADFETSKENEKFVDADNANEDFSNNGEDSFMDHGCKLVLSNECLKINSITILEPEIFNLTSKTSKEFQFQRNIVEENNKKDHGDFALINKDSSLTSGLSLDSNNPFIPGKDAETQKFFRSLLRIHEKEMELCNELFKDDDFLNNVLLPAVEERKNIQKRSKKRRFSRFFKWKVQDNQAKFDENKYQPKSNSQIEASTKLQSLALNAKKCFTMLAEAVKINENIDDEVKICGLLKLLQRIESGDFCVIQNDEDPNFEGEIKFQVKEAFINIYEICEKEAKKVKRHIGEQEINLIKGFVSKYRVGLLSKTDIVACYIGRGVIHTEAQLKAAVTYLMRSQSNEVDVKKFEKYCNVTESLEK